MSRTAETPKTPIAQTPIAETPIALTPIASLLRAIDLVERERPSEARALANEAAEGAPSDAAVRIAAAQICFAARDREGAFAHLAALAATGKGDVALAWRARLLRRSGRVRAALEALGELAQREGQAAQAHAYAAEIRAVAHDDAGALHDLDAAIAARPGVAALHVQRAAALEKLGRIDEARRAIAAAAALPGPAALRLEVAQRQIDLGAEIEAEAALRALLAGEHGARARAALARLALFRGDVAGASALAEEALAIDGEVAEAHCARGAARVLRGEPREAIAALDRAVAVDGRLYEAFLWRAEARYRLEEWPAAIDDLERATGEFGDYFAAHVLRLLIAIRTATSRQVVPSGPTESVVAGVAALLPDGAAEIASEDPDRIAPALERALSALRGNRSLAITAVREGVGEHRVERIWAPPSPRFAAKWTIEGIQALPLAEVLHRFEAVLRDNPRSSKPYCYRGELLLWMGDYDAARADFERSIAIDPGTRWAYIGLGASRMFVGKLDEALAVFARGLSVAGPGPTIHVYRGETHLRRGDIARAAEDLEIACKLNPSRISAWVNLALVREESGNREDRRAIMERLAREAPWLFHDVATSLGIGAHEISDVALLQRCLEMMRGNRSSTCITYFVGDELRIAPFDARDGASLGDLRRSLEAIAKPRSAGRR